MLIILYLIFVPAHKIACEVKNILLWLRRVSLKLIRDVRKYIRISIWRHSSVQTNYELLRNLTWFILEWTHRLLLYRELWSSKYFPLQFPLNSAFPFQKNCGFIRFVTFIHSSLSSLVAIFETATRPSWYHDNNIAIWPIQFLKMFFLILTDDTISIINADASTNCYFGWLLC